MSGKVLSLLLIFLGGMVFAAQADVSGSFDISIKLDPEGTQTEAVKLVIDLQSNLQVNITLSGLTFGADLGFGNTGVEFAVLSLNTNLGALQVSDLFIFATPFYNTGTGGANIHPTVDLLGNVNGPGFVAKRITLELNIAGFTLTNLAMFEDVDFSSPSGTTNPVYDLSGVDNVVDNQTPTFGFGDVITLSGQTVSGITVTGSTFFCAAGSTAVKKRSWSPGVNKACTAQFGMNTTPLEGGAKTPLLFEKETLAILGIEIGGVDLSINTTFVPLTPVSSTINASFSVLDLADVSVSFTSDNITSLSLTSIVTSIDSGNISISLTDTGGDFSIDSASFSFSMTLNPNQNPASLSISVGLATGGITSASATLGISRGGFSFDTSSTFGNGPGTLSWTSTTFGISISGDTLSSSFDLSYTPTGMGTASISLGVDF